jgi:hypothetical protein
MSMDKYEVKDEQELALVLAKIVAKDRGAYVNITPTNAYPAVVETNVKLNTQIK